MLMFRKLLAGGTALALAIFLGTSEAQAGGHGGGGHGGGGHGGGGGHASFHGSSFHGSSFHSASFHSASFNRGFRSVSFNRGFNNGRFNNSRVFVNVGFGGWGWGGWGWGWGSPWWGGWGWNSPWWWSGNSWDSSPTFVSYAPTSTFTAPVTYRIITNSGAGMPYADSVSGYTPSPDGTYPYDGGPAAPIPMPRVLPKPQPPPIPPQEGQTLSTSSAKAKYTYAAYGEEPTRVKAAQDRSVIVKKDEGKK
jgi:hypothetical protein